VVELGYTLSSEEFAPNDLVAQARRAEEAGFAFALISDHFHPWMDSQGHSPFVWTTLGGVANVTERMQIGTGVTAPIIRYHPAIIAQAAATVAAMMPGRFFLGVGTGEYLNEHITGEHWPPISRRQDMLVEAVGIIRDLWAGGYTTRYGDFYTVENARLYTLPEALPPIHVAASGTESAAMAGKLGDGLISTSPDGETVTTFSASGGEGKPRYGQMTICWAEDEQEAMQTAYKYWGYTVLPGQMSQELALPAYYDAGAELVTPEDVAKKVVCGNDVERYLKQIQQYVDAGFTHVYLHQVGPDQEGYIRFAERELLPRFRS